SVLEWSQLPSLPDPIGLAGPFVGVSNDILIIAGGANFPDGPPWEGNPKVWHDKAFVLTDPKGTWLSDFKLPRPLGYGVSVTYNDRVVCVGGGDKDRHYANVFMLNWTENKLETTPLPPMPRPCAFFAGVLVGDVVYVAGGQESPSATEALHNFWSLDLSETTENLKWQQLEPWPGKARILPVMAVQEGNIYLISGANLYKGTDGKVTRRFLTDCYCYNPQSKHWKQIADAPRPIVAAPNPGIPLGHAHILFLSGDDGENFFRAVELKDKHPGFGPDLFVYNTITDTWTKMGEFPKNIPGDLGKHRNAGTWPPVTTTITKWKGRYVVPTGEARPGIRTPKVLWAKPTAMAGSFGVTNYAVLGIYLTTLVAMGFYFARREKTIDDFFLAGRRIPWWAAGLSIFGTQLSAITYLAMPARSYVTDWALLVLNIGIFAMAPFVIHLYLPILRRLNITTAYEYLEKRFHVSIRLFGSLSFVVFQLGRMGIVVLLPALALSAVTGLNVYLCIALMGFLSTVYTVLGGIEAVIWTDVLQGFVLIGGAFAALWIIVGNLDGGFSQVISVGIENGKFNPVHLNWDWTSDALIVVILGAVFTNALVPYTTDQAVIQRYLTTPHEKQAGKAIWLNGFLSIFAGILFLSVGTGLFVFYKANPQSLAPLEKADQIFALFIARQMPSGLAGLVIAGVFAAAMSSLDSSMHSIATAVTTDFVRRFRPNFAESTYLVFARCLTIALGISGTATAMLMASIEIKFLWDFFIGIMGLLGGTLAGLFMLGIFTRKVSVIHAWIGAIASIGTLLYVKLGTDLNGLLYGVIGVTTCFVIACLFSRILPTGIMKMTGLTIYDVPDSRSNSKSS
ncbi:MAG: sodium/solute symporter, partial [Phycisphaerae bacterium]|nr:sodium/solute symporter [Phycisphaerae bacterium]NIR64160.1 sodium/solute symporter [candidate division Zixibacteria bacterium]NIS51114.1 sodium/solute symporter [Phycisphaerae bacterium]NIU08773.1 sodium/solute symporter [Phycisphaerae bacterium]NIU56377.1 sodium/solute symporter [Phycisphaerae bacterium]